MATSNEKICFETSGNCDTKMYLYDQNLKIECICYVRDEVKFNNSNELIEQLKKDKEFIINKNLMLAKK